MKQTKLLNNWQITTNGETRPVHIPHDFVVGTRRDPGSPGSSDEGYFMPGRAEYQTTFPAEPEAANHFLRFDGVMGLTEVYVNDNLVNFHAYGYTPFHCDISRFVKEGENRVRVVADNTSQVTSRWYTGAGIFREVTLYTAGVSYICPRTLFVKTEALLEQDASVRICWKVYAAKAQTAEVTIAIPELQTELRRSIWLEPGENEYSVQTMLHDITAWTPDTPKLYDCTLTLHTEDACDTDGTAFGIRTVLCDSKKGFLLNGKPVKLYGTCVHHDNGIVGAASYRSAEERRVRVLKENGYNCIRCAHNPPSDVMLDACDRLGMMVIDEIFDAWRLPKRNFDYHIWFDRNWQDDTDSMVLRDRTHPSVIMWSTGNEIADKNGMADGFQTSRRIADRIRLLDDTRPLTHAFCSFWDNAEYSAREQATNNTPPEELDFFTDRIRYTAGTLDVFGYNYLLHRIPADEVRFPDRLFVMTESFALDAVIIKKFMDAHPRMIGDFIWTGWDYFGETGIGHVNYGTDKTASWGLTAFPNHIADCGDIDICGWRKAPSYYREAAWKENCVRILTADPAKHGQVYAISGWGFYDVNRSWTWPGSEGKVTTVHVYTLADECELWQDGVSVGRKAPDEKGIAVFEIPYRPGTLTAVSYKNGAEVGRDELVTTGAPAAMRISPMDKNDLIYAEIDLLDEAGNIAWTGADNITVTVEGGTLLATGSGENATEHIYTDATCAAYHGRILAAVLPDCPCGEVKITAVSGDFRAEAVVNG